MAGTLVRRVEPSYFDVDALRSLGIGWETVLEHIQPDQVRVHSSSGFGQMDNEGYGGMHQARMKGDRVTTKALAMGRKPWRSTWPDGKPA